MAAYDNLDRAALAAALCNSLPDLEEPELQALTESVILKMDNMTDDEFDALDRIPDFDFDTEGEPETEG